MKRLLCVLAGMTAAGTLSAAPTVSDVEISQDPVTRNVTVSYTLSAAAVVTVEILTNNQPIAAREISRMVAGDLNRKVEAGRRAVYWRADRGWPGAGAQFDSCVKARVTAWPLDNPPDFMVCDLCFPGQRRYYVSAEALPYDLTNVLYKTDQLVMRKIPAKNVRWHMGAAKNASNNYSDFQARETYHYVTFSYDYYMAVFKTTRAHYNRIMGNAVTNVNDTAYHIPAGYVSYHALRGSTSDGIDWPDTLSTVTAASVINRVRVFTGVNSMDLPTEAEWEYACRAGTATDFNNGKNLSGTWAASPDGIAWDSSCAGGQMHPVGEKPCNNWQIYGFHGNGFEWCLDWDLVTPYALDSEQTDPVGPKSSDPGAPTERSARSNFYSCSALCMRSATRSHIAPGTGHNVFNCFRLKCAASAE